MKPRRNMTPLLQVHKNIELQHNLTELAMCRKPATQRCLQKKPLSFVDSALPEPRLAFTQF